LNIFSYKLTLWSSAARFFVGPKFYFLSLQMLIYCKMHGGNFWNFFHIFSNQHTTRSYSYMHPKIIFFLMALMLKMAPLKFLDCHFEENIVKELKGLSIKNLILKKLFMIFLLKILFPEVCWNLKFFVWEALEVEPLEVDTLDLKGEGNYITKKIIE